MENTKLSNFIKMTFFSRQAFILGNEKINSQGRVFHEDKNHVR